MKRKQKRKHLEDAYIPQSANKTKKTLSLQEYALQPRHDRVVPTQDQEAKDSSSEYFPGVSSVDKLAGAGISNFNQYNPQFGYSLENNNMVREARDRSSESEYFSCYSSFSNFYNVSNTEVLDSVEDDEQPGPSGLPQRTLPRAKDSDSDDVTSVSSSGVSQVQKSVSSLGYPLVSLSQNREQWESPFPPPLDNNNKPPVRVTEETITKICYIAVPRKRSTAVLDTEERLDPPRKKKRKEEMSFPEEIHTPVSLSALVTKELPTESETNFAGEAQEKEEDAGTSAEPTAPGECSSANVPEPPVAVDNDFKCMGCCRIFPSLEVLQKHVEHGIEQGFSCHAFHLAMAFLQSKKNKKKKKKKIKKTTSTFQ
ncbi:protein FAM170A-like [Equus przewalskii]|uniref:Protein FAM170A-like n=1 Tax=Equus przewalskii TaxID=9798 RepID=A0ABM4KBK4_EQUPR